MIKQLNQALLLFLSALFLLITACQPAEKPATTSPTLQLSDYQGQWLVLNYWASWCTACLEEIPELNRFYQQHLQQNLKKVALVGVNYEETFTGSFTELVKKMKIEYPVVTGDPVAQLGITITGLPTTVIINPQGKVQKILQGAQTQAALEEVIKQG
jgi:thiol-disulfide isomerase/thioredoxin